MIFQQDNFIITVLADRFINGHWMDLYYIMTNFHWGLVTPLIALMFFVLLPSFRSDLIWRYLAIFALASQLVLNLWVVAHLDFGGHMSLYIKYFDIDFGFFSTTISLAIDYMSMFFYLLVPFIFLLCAVSVRPGTSRSKLLYALILVMDPLLMNVFLSYDYLHFFIFLELSILPMFLLISIWGSRSRRSYAAYTYFFFSMFASVFFLVSIIILSAQTGSTSLWSYYFEFTTDDLMSRNLIPLEFEYSMQLTVFALLFLSLAIKMPVFPFHIWLPEAHGEASTVGSVVLAALFLKMAGFGIFRYVMPFFPMAYDYYQGLGLAVGTIGTLYCSLIIFRQVDLKKFIAYSSVIHMNLMVVALFSPDALSLQGAYYTMLAHTIVASLLFFVAGIIYDRYHTRIVFYMPDLASRMPVIAFLMFFALVSNAGFPVSGSFIAELHILIGVFRTSPLVAFLCLVGVCSTAVAHFLLINRMVYGTTASDYKYFVKAVPVEDKLKYLGTDQTILKAKTTWDWRTSEIVYTAPLLFLTIHMNYAASSYFWYFSDGIAVLLALLSR
jgi:NADH-quinone oxidoreductase subunit M